MKKWWRIIGSFAFLVVFFTALSVAVITNYCIPGFTIALGFLLGGIVSPPDAVSTGAIMKFVKVPKSMAAILEGESLLNDASSLIIFRFALVAVGTGQIIWQEAALSFLWMVVGGAGIGLILAWIFVQAHKRLLYRCTFGYCAYAYRTLLYVLDRGTIAQFGRTGGCCGRSVYVRARLFFLNSTSRVRGYSVWESFIFILNGIVFLVIGLDLPEIVAGLNADGIPLFTAIKYGLLVTGVLIAARIISSYAAMIATLIFRPAVAPRASSNRTRLLMPLLLGWTGMQGVVSLAAALAIPVTLSDGTAFPHRNLILFITFIAILLTLLVQGLTLPFFIKRANFLTGFNEASEEATKRKIKQGLRGHVYEFLKGKYENELDGHAGVQKILQHWEEKTKAADDDWMNEKTKIIFLEMLECQRAYLTALNKDPEINEELIRTQLYQIDLEEERLKIV